MLGFLQYPLGCTNGKTLMPLHSKIFFSGNNIFIFRSILLPGDSSMFFTLSKASLPKARTTLGLII